MKQLWLAAELDIVESRCARCSQICTLVFGGIVAVGWATIQGIEVPGKMFGYYTALLAVMAMCFLGIGMLITTIVRTAALARFDRI